jgi:CTP:molybdopterin cytidylyltransferase MocA
MLARLSGDQGARSLLKSAYQVTSPPGALVDVDDPETLRSLSCETI